MAGYKHRSNQLNTQMIYHYQFTIKGHTVYKILLNLSYYQILNKVRVKRLKLYIQQYLLPSSLESIQGR